MKKLLVLSITVFCAISSFAQDRAAQLTDKLYNSKDYVFVVAHRGDWRFAPENSLPAFQHCIDEGVDMVELDLHSVFVMVCALKLMCISLRSVRHSICVRTRFSST